MKQTKQTRQVKKTKQTARKEIKKVETKKQDNSMKYLGLFIIIVVFAFSFAMLIDKQQKDSYMNDLNENGFNVKPQLGKVIVSRDMTAIYPKYYVVYVNEDEYSIYVYNYYETTSQYELEYARLINDIVDYNAKDKMIRYLFGKGYGTYNEVLSNLSVLVDCDNLRIY